MDEQSKLSDGYAEVGDQRLHYVEAGEGPLIVLLHGFPEFWYGWRLQIEPLAAAGFRVVAPDLRGYNLSSQAGRRRGLRHRPAGRRHPRPHPRARRRVRARWSVTTGAEPSPGHTAMNHPEVVDRLAILNAAHPRKLSQGLHHPGQLRKSWYFFFFALPGLPEAVVHADDWHFFRHFLHDAHPAYTPEEIDRYIEAWSQPGAATAMINYYRSSVRHRRRKPRRSSARSRRPRWSSGASATATSARNWPSPTTTTCPTSTASSACPTPRTGSTTTRPSASTQLLIDFFAPARRTGNG